MTATVEAVKAALERVALPGGGDPVSADLIRALTIDGGSVRFVIDAPDPESARALEPVRAASEAAVRALPGVTSVSAVLTAHGPAPKAPSLKMGGHMKPQASG